MISHLVDARGPSLRNSVLAFRQDDTVQFIFTANGTVKTFAADDMIIQLVSLLDGSRSEAELAREVSGSPSYSLEHFDEAMRVMREENLLLEPERRDQAPDFTTAELARYDRQLLLFADISADGTLPPGRTALDLQRSIRDSTVVVLGIGGLGGWLATALAAAGVGTLRICDFDSVEPSNLNRQILFSAADTGRSKIACAAEKLGIINPHTAVEPIELHLGPDSDLAATLADADLVINCADRPSALATSEWLFRACWHRGIPHIIGGSYSYHLGLLGTTLLPGQTACWECLRAETADDHGRDRATVLAPRSGPGASLVMFVGVLGNLLAWEALRILTGMPAALANRWAEVDFRNLAIRSRTITRRPECQYCGTSLEQDQNHGNHTAD
jgi:bacteriocin biosynthesis cyclodehydratase domain-containing protein